MSTTTITAPQSTPAPAPTTDPTTIGPPKTELNITVEFTGGLEILFNNVSKHRITLPATLPSTPASIADLSNSEAAAVSTSESSASPAPTTIGYLIQHLTQNLLKDPRKELFVLDGTVRPGILVLINDADWELEGEASYELQDGDNVLFVSTLHGG